MDESGADRSPIGISQKESMESMTPSDQNWVNRLKNRAQKLFRKEALVGESNVEPEPNVEIDIIYAPHMTAQDLDGTRAHLATADIFIPENIGWSKKDYRIFNDVSQGKKTLVHVNNYDYVPFGYAVLEMIAETGKPVAFIDLPEGHPLIRDFDRIDGLITTSLMGPTNETDNFAGFLMKERSLIEEDAGLQDRREEYMLNELPNTVKETIKRNPQLKGKSKLRVLLQLGAIHTPLFHRLRKEELDVAWDFNSSSLVYNFYSEAIRRQRFNMEIDDTLLAKAWFENFTANFFLDRDGRVTQNTNKIVQFQRNVISQFSLGEIQNIFDQLSHVTTEVGSAPVTDAVYKEWSDKIDLILRGILQAKNIQLPRSAEELDQFLSAKTDPKKNS